jgi:hypothetical protein
MDKVGKEALTEVQTVIERYGRYKKNPALTFSDWKQQVLIKYQRPQSIPYEGKLRQSRDIITTLFVPDFPSSVSLVGVKEEMDKQRGNTSRLFMGCESVIKVYISKVVDYHKNNYIDALLKYKLEHENVLISILSENVSFLAGLGSRQALDEFSIIFNKLWSEFYERMMNHLDRTASHPQLAHEDAMKSAVRNYRNNFLKTIITNLDVERVNKHELINLIQKKIDTPAESEEVEETCVKIRSYWNVASCELQTAISKECGVFETQVKDQLTTFLDMYSDFSLFEEKKEMTHQSEYLLRVEDELSSLLHLIRQSRK